MRTPATPVVDVWIAEIAGKAGLPLRAAMTTQHVSAMPMIVAASDLLAMIPREVYEIFRKVANIRSVRLTRAGPVIEVQQFWHPRNTGDPAQKFFRDLVFAATREH